MTPVVQSVPVVVRDDTRLAAVRAAGGADRPGGRTFPTHGDVGHNVT
jgi:hypothetical protein